MRRLFPLFAPGSSRLRPWRPVSSLGVLLNRNSNGHASPKNHSHSMSVNAESLGPGRHERRSSREVGGLPRGHSGRLAAVPDEGTRQVLAPRWAIPSASTRPGARERRCEPGPKRRARVRCLYFLVATWPRPSRVVSRLVCRQPVTFAFSSASHAAPGTARHGVGSQAEPVACVMECSRPVRKNVARQPSLA